MRKRIKKFAKRIVHRENITAVSMIVIFGFVSLSLGFASFVFSYWRGWQTEESTKTQKNSAYLDELRRLSGITTELKAVPDVTASWKTYESEKYGFSIKYPTNWSVSAGRPQDPEKKYLEAVTFSSGKDKGFYVYVYSASQFPGPEGTDDLLKKNEKIPAEACSRFTDISLGEEGYPAKEIDVKGGDPCYEETFFYSLAKDGYRYNIVPLEAGYNISDYDDKVTLIKAFPEFYDIVSTFGLNEKANVASTTRKVVQKTVAAPRARFTSGASCRHKNDHPRKSKQGKGKHMDEDCCPDPDEWPNPGCAYSGKGLGIMISR